MTAPKSLPPSADIPIAASPGEGAATPVRCSSCGHVAIPARRCECGHIEMLHNLAADERTRKACSMSDGPKATPCGCRLFTEPSEGLPND